MRFYLPEPLYVPLRGQLSTMRGNEFGWAIEVLDDFSLDPAEPGYFVVTTDDPAVMAAIVHAADVLASDRTAQAQAPELSFLADLFVRNARAAASGGATSTGPLPPPDQPSGGEIGLGVLASVATAAKWIAVAATIVVTALVAGEEWGIAWLVGGLLLFPITFVVGPWIAALGIGNWVPVALQIGTIAISSVAFLMAPRARNVIAKSRFAR